MFERSNPNAWVKSPANPRRTAVHINFRDVWNFEMTVSYPPWKSEFMTYPVTILYAHLFTFAVENRSLLVYFADSIPMWAIKHNLVVWLVIRVVHGSYRHAADTPPLEGLLILRCAIYDPFEGLQFWKMKVFKTGV